MLLLLQANASSKALECDLLRKKLSAAEGGMSALKGDLAERDAEMDALRQAVKDAEAAASEEQEKAAEEVSRVMCWTKSARPACFVFVCATPSSQAAAQHSVCSLGW
jgi:peptidoglycan hydrolase CwlO-like protein